MHESCMKQTLFCKGSICLPHPVMLDFSDESLLKCWTSHSILCPFFLPCPCLAENDLPWSLRLHNDSLENILIFINNHVKLQIIADSKLFSPLLTTICSSEHTQVLLVVVFTTNTPNHSDLFLLEFF